MKTSQLLCVALAVALGVVCWKAAGAGSAPDTGTSDSVAADNAAYDCIMTRGSCRSFTDQRVGEGQIDSLLHAAMAAPTARDQRAWQLVVVTDRDILDSIAAECSNIKMAAQAPMAIVACGDLDIAREKGAEQFWDQDLAAVSQNILLAAHSMGLGAVWCGIYPIDERVKFVSSLLELPANVVPLSVIPVGYPQNPVKPKDKYDQERVHYNGW